MRAQRILRVLLVDDSESSRADLRRILECHCGAAVVGTAVDGEEALRAAIRLAPDLVLLDLQMPRMDGYTFLRLLMARQPTPVIVLSTQSRKSDVFKALAFGALDFVPKPEGPAPLEALRELLVEKCRMVGALAVENLSPSRDAPPAAFPRAPLTEPAGILAIGASTGGPQAVQRLLALLPGQFPAAVVLAQHMPEQFTAAFADRLSRTTPFSVREAEPGDVVSAGRVLVAPGGRHLEVVRGADGTLRAAVGAPLRAAARGACPSVDRLFGSVARAVGPRACGVVLTGMGNDGSAGVAEIKRAGGLTLAESSETAVVYGMPQAAVETGAVDDVLPLPGLAERIAAHWDRH